MKKMKKISKIFLVLTMIFSQLSSVVTVLADETYHSELVGKTVTVTGSTGAITCTGISDAAKKELTDTIGSTECKLTSKDYKDKTITFTIDADGKVTQSNPS